MIDNRKISELEPATLPLGLDNADSIPVARGSTTRRIIGLNLKSSILGDIPTNVTNLLTFENLITNQNFSFNAVKTFTDSVRLQKNVNQDAITISGRNGGTQNYSLDIVPGVLGSSRTYTVPDVNANASFVMTAGNQTLDGIKSFSNSIVFTNTNVTNALDLGNNNIVNVNNITIADPGSNEGISWLNGNLWKIYESPNDLITNAGGNLQIVQNATRRATFNTSGQLEIPVATGTAPLVISSTTRVANLNVASAGIADTLLTTRTIWGQNFNGSANVAGDITGAGNISFGTQTNKATLTYTTNTARTYTVPDVGANANFVMTAGDQTISGIKTFGQVNVGGAASPAVGRVNLIQGLSNQAGYVEIRKADDTRLGYFGWNNTTMNIECEGTAPNRVLRVSAADGLICTGEITAFASDKRLKENIKPLNHALEKINNLNGFIYNFNDLGVSLGFNKSIKHVGVFAQEVQKVLPEAVCCAPFDKDEDGSSKSGEDYLTVKYEKIVPLLIEAIKELTLKVNNLENKIN